MTSIENNQPHIGFKLEESSDEVKVCLPPVASWNGTSERFVVGADHKWVTRAERSDFTETPDYKETLAWLRDIANACENIELKVMGQTAGQRDIWYTVVGNGELTPDRVRQTGKAVILVQAGIHPGEIDGKDAMLMLLRDMVLGDRKHLLDDCIILFVPILNVDGFERFGPFNRINQRGPVNVGWSTNDSNLNLNRDFGKLDAPETRAVLSLVNEWQPDLYVDTHVTDGADYQYDVTFGHTSGAHGWSPNISQWLEDALLPDAREALMREGHTPGPLTLAVNDRDFQDGRIGFTANARFSTGMSDLRHLPAILVENHSLKTFKQRVLGMYVLLESLIEGLAKGRTGLRDAVEKDKSRRMENVSLGWTVDPNVKSEKQPFKGIRCEEVYSGIAKENIPHWTGEPDNQPVAVVKMDKPVATARRPRAYYIPPHLSDIVQRLEYHGVLVQQLQDKKKLKLTRTRLPEACVTGGRPEFGITGTTASRVSEGRVRVTAGRAVPEIIEVEMPAKSYCIQTNQPLGDLVMVLLDPQSPDSFFQWGFFLGIMENTAYSEPYVLDPLAREILAASPALAAEYARKMKKEERFAENAEIRRAWFMSHTPYNDCRHMVYPVLREE